MTLSRVLKTKHSKAFHGDTVRWRGDVYHTTITADLRNLLIPHKYYHRHQTESKSPSVQIRHFKQNMVWGLEAWWETVVSGNHLLIRRRADLLSWSYRLCCVHCNSFTTNPFQAICFIILLPQDSVILLLPDFNLLHSDYED